MWGRGGDGTWHFPIRSGAEARLITALLTGQEETRTTGFHALHQRGERIWCQNDLFSKYLPRSLTKSGWGSFKVSAALTTSELITQVGRDEESSESESRGMERGLSVGPDVGHRGTSLWKSYGEFGDLFLTGLSPVSASRADSTNTWPTACISQQKTQRESDIESAW